MVNGTIHHQSVKPFLVHAMAKLNLQLIQRRPMHGHIEYGRTFQDLDRALQRDSLYGCTFGFSYDCNCDRRNFQASCLCVACFASVLVISLPFFLRRDFSSLSLVESWLPEVTR
jgi:hypothetical protein